MRNENEIPETDTGSGEAAPDNVRRNILRFAALGGAAVVTVRPGIAQAAVSAIKCSIPVPDSANAGKWIKTSNGNVVAANSANAIAGPPSALPGEDVKNSLRFGTTYPGYSAAQTTTWNKYINKLNAGTQGYTCFASVQNPAS